MTSTPRTCAHALLSTVGVKRKQFRTFDLDSGVRLLGRGTLHRGTAIIDPQCILAIVLVANYYNRCGWTSVLLIVGAGEEQIR